MPLLKTLSLKQPWADLLVRGLKRIEVRRWTTPHRGPVFLHAARDDDDRPAALTLLCTALPAEIHRRGLIGVGDLVDVKHYPTRESFVADRELHLNEDDWFEPGGLFGFVFANVREIPYQSLPGQVRLFHVEHPPPLSTRGLLVSVRSAEEAVAALAGGATLIDVKEPSRGPLGMADARVIGEVIDAVAGRAPVSAALGELADWPDGTLPPCVDRLTYVKWGLARSGGDWAKRFAAVRARVESSSPCRVVMTCYADYRRASSPHAADVQVEAVGQRPEALLIDTAVKDGLGLTHWMTRDDLDVIRFYTEFNGVKLALAGSLGEGQMAALGVVPDWFAVRGAACEGGDRVGAVDAKRVRRLTDFIAGYRRGGSRLAPEATTGEPPPGKSGPRAPAAPPRPRRRPKGS